MRAYINIYESLQGKIITLCDEELLGRTIKQSDMKYNIGEFYKGELVNLSKVDKEFFEDVSSIHAIGKNVIKRLLDIGIINREDLNKVRYIGDVPILLIFYV
ncbi:MAG TPA: DUF424 family protein [Candidatus Nanopusillus sp.]|nr:DUF424 family protein [Candidatus Nanopusillus sp.]